ncbi:MAG TPA: LamG-like jellyroll fold domain-containing protein [Solirubrobacteraceae bacterium]|nr:LamG-like jellyroll fold domain-containing protein [Solirubrobacteraceae bacterium]
MPNAVRRFALSVAVACLAAIAACPASAGAWSRPRSGGLGHQTLRGGAGADYLRGAEGPDTVNGNGGGDLLTGDTGPDIISGGGGGDTINGGAGNDRVRGGTGNDIVTGGFGADRIEGGPGDDALVGDNDADTIHGGDGNDVLHGGSGIDNLYGEGGDDRIFADSGAGEILGGDGDDTIVVDGATRSVVNCGPGNDRLYVSIDADATEDYAGGLKIFGFPGCETVFLTDALGDPNKGVTYLARDRGGAFDGTAGDDTLLGGPGADTLRGGDGNDVLWGLRQPDVRSAATDVLDAGAGDDTVYGGPGPQRILGGAGDDFLESGVGDGTIAGGSGDDTIRLRGGGTTKVDAGPGNDTVYARGTARARITCGSGRDVVHVDAGDRVARDCERRVGSTAARARTRFYADDVAATPGLVHRWRLGEPPVLAAYAFLADSAGSSSSSLYGDLGVPGVVDDGDTAYQSQSPDTTYNTNSFISLGMSDALLHGEFTYEAWYRSDDTGTARALLSDLVQGTADGVVLVREASGALRVVMSASADPAHGIDLRTAPLDLTPRSWHHVALTRADGRVAIYVDGVVRAETAASPIVYDHAGYGIDVGQSFSVYKAWAGGIDEIALYDRPLDAATIDAHFRSGDDGTPPVAVAVGLQPTAVQPRSGVVSLRADPPLAGASFRCSQDGGAYTPCGPDVPLAKVADGDHEWRILATSRTGVTQVTPTPLRFKVDTSVPGTLLAVRIDPDGDGRAIATFGSDSDASFECRQTPRNYDPDAGWAPCTAPLDVPPGAQFQVRAFDDAGNVDTTPASINVPPASGGFAFGLRLPTFAGTRAEASMAGEFFASGTFQCRIDARAWASCAQQLRLPILDAGRHLFQVRQPTTGQGGVATTAPILWSVAPRPGDVAIAGLQTQLVLERTATLLRRDPSVRFALSHPASVTVDVVRRGRRPLIRVAASGRTGANVVRLPARRVHALRQGRYTLRVSARGATGTTAVQELPLALVPRLR